MPFPPALVRAASNAADDVAMQHAVHEGYMRLIQGLARAVEFGWAGFKQKAYFSGVSINGPLALGGPGCLRGPEPQIASAPVVAAWIGWEKSIVHAFATWPGPQATPMANVPTPLAAMIAPLFLAWLGAQMVSGVLGHGPVPGFAPPHSPVGPVVGGEVLPNPDCLAT